jgi:ribosomal protein S6--L-glutamate ligase
MDICLLMDNPETPHHPVLGAVLHTLSSQHKVRLLDVRNYNQQALREEALPLADLYLLKSHALEALELAQYLEQQGARVVNSYAASEACRDRALTALRLREAKLPGLRTLSLPALKYLTFPPGCSLSLMVKSRFSYRGDLVMRLQTPQDLESLLDRWSLEPVVVQDFVDNDGWDIKLWVIDQQVFAAKRRTPLEEDASKKDYPIEEIPEEWLKLAREVGRAFGLQLYGLDLVVTEKGPFIIDVNAFPGFRGVPGTVEALLALIETCACSVVHEEGGSRNGANSLH